MYILNNKTYTPEVLTAAAEKQGLTLEELIAKKGIKPYNKPKEVKKTMYYTQDGTPYNVSEDELAAFKQKLPEARTEQGWKEFGEKQTAEIEKYNKAIAETKSKNEKKRLEAEKAKLENQEKLQQKNRDEIALRFKKEIESDYSKEHNWGSRPDKMKEYLGVEWLENEDGEWEYIKTSDGYSHEEKVKWLNEHAEENNLDKKYVAELDFEDPEFDIDEAILDESKLDIPQPINVMGVMTSQLEDSEDIKLGDDFYEGLKKYNADIQSVLSNPIKGENGKVDYEAIQAAIDEIEANAPSALEVKEVDVDALGELAEPIEDSFEVNLSEKEYYEAELKKRAGIDWQKDLLLGDNFNKVTKIKADIYAEILEKRKEKLQQYKNGEIELSMLELSEIADVDQGMKDYMEKFLPSPEEMVDMEDSKLDNTRNVLNAVQAATQAAVMNDPRFQFIQENIIKDVDAQAKSKLERRNTE